MFQELGAALLTAAAILAEPAATAQPAPPPATDDAAAPCCTIPARTSIQIVIADPVNSRTARNGQTFAIRLAAPILVDGQLVVPAGTTGAGEVVHAARARAMGKAGELILAVRYLDLNGRRIPLRSLRYGPAQGRDDSNGVLVGSSVVGAFVPVASALAFLIAGGEIDIPAGTVAHAQTAAEMVLPPATTD